MIISERNDVLSNLRGDKFRLSNNYKIFNILSNKLYSDKIGSIIRELACNCVDSHKQAGVSIPFNINLNVKSNVIAGNIDYSFSIEDFGVGLSEEDIYKVYACYGESTKSDSNEYIGAFGLGSKSVFSYTDSFYITSTYNGRRYFYLAYIDDESFPSISKIDEIETKEHNGLKIMFSIKKEDVNEFRNKIYEELKRFDPLPVIVNDPDFWNKNKEFNFIIYSGKSINIFSKKDFDYRSVLSVLIDDKLEYKIDFLSAKIDYDKIKFFDIIQSMNKIELKFDIGELDLTASREEIEYTKRTIENINKKIDCVINEVFSLIGLNDKVDFLDSLFLFDYICLNSKIFIDIVGEESFQNFISFLKKKYEKPIKQLVLNFKRARFFYYSFSNKFGKRKLIKINNLTVDDIDSVLNSDFKNILKFINPDNVIIRSSYKFIFIDAYLTSHEIKKIVKNNNTVFVLSHKSKNIKSEDFISEVEEFSSKLDIKFIEHKVDNIVINKNLDNGIFLYRNNNKKMSIDELSSDYLYIYKYKNAFYFDYSHSVKINDVEFSVIKEISDLKNKEIVVINCTSVKKDFIDKEYFKIDNIKKFIIEFINDDNRSISKYLKMNIAFDYSDDANFVSEMSERYFYILKELVRKYGLDKLNKKSKIFELSNLYAERCKLSSEMSNVFIYGKSAYRFYYDFCILIKSLGLKKDILNMLINNDFYNKIEMFRSFIFSNIDIFLYSFAMQHGFYSSTELTDKVTDKLLEFVNKF